jgi:hypothetical protein
MGHLPYALQGALEAGSIALFEANGIGGGDKALGFSRPAEKNFWGLANRSAHWRVEEYK